MRQDLAFWGLCSEGEQRRPCLLGDYDCHHFYLDLSLLLYSRHVDQYCALPDWTNTYGEWTTALKEKGLLKWELVHCKKERSYGTHLVFLAPPTDLCPTTDTWKAPSWNQWDPALPFCKKNILTNKIYFLLYGENFEYLIDIAKALCKAGEF
jgi:hypothetical protein